MPDLENSHVPMFDADHEFTAAERRFIVTACRVCPQYRYPTLPATWVAETEMYRESEEDRALDRWMRAEIAKQKRGGRA